MSHETFKVGEIAILTVSGFCGSAGDEVEVRGSVNDPVWGFQWLIRGRGVELMCNPTSIRKRRPPQDWVKLCNLIDVPREVSHV